MHATGFLTTVRKAVTMCFAELCLQNPTCILPVLCYVNLTLYVIAVTSCSMGWIQDCTASPIATSMVGSEEGGLDVCSHKAATILNQFAHQR